MEWAGTVRDHLWYGYGLDEMERRAGHALIATNQIYTVVQGRIWIEVEHAGLCEKILLTDHMSLFNGKLVWHTVWTDDHESILMVLADNEYDRDQLYIEDREEWQRLTALTVLT
ncbi:MAG: WxcM-like domain-containing protein [Candidatus Magasanikbacteria bacterium]